MDCAYGGQRVRQQRRLAGVRDKITVRIFDGIVQSQVGRTFLVVYNKRVPQLTIRSYLGRFRSLTMMYVESGQSGHVLKDWIYQRENR